MPATRREPHGQQHAKPDSSISPASTRIPLQYMRCKIGKLGRTWRMLEAGVTRGLVTPRSRRRHVSSVDPLAVQAQEQDVVVLGRADPIPSYRPPENSTLAIGTEKRLWEMRQNVPCPTGKLHCGITQCASCVRQFPGNMADGNRTVG